MYRILHIVLIDEIRKNVIKIATFRSEKAAKVANSTAFFLQN